MATQPELPEQLARRATSLRTLAVVAAGLFLAGAAAVPLLYGQRWARADQFEEHIKEFRAVKSQVDRHDGLLQYIHDDLEDIKKQDVENAKAVGAPNVTRVHP